MNYKTYFALASSCFVLTACGPTNNGADAPTEAEVRPLEVAKLYPLGEPIKTAEIEVVLKSVETKKIAGNPNWVDPAGPGETYVIAQYSLKNLGKAPINPFELPDVALLDQNGVEYGSDLEASSAASPKEDSYPLDEVNPGVTYNDTLAWKVLEENYDPTTWMIVVRSDPQLAFRLK